MGPIPFYLRGGNFSISLCRSYGSDCGVEDGLGKCVKVENIFKGKVGCSGKRSYICKQEVRIPRVKWNSYLDKGTYWRISVIYFFIVESGN